MTPKEWAKEIIGMENVLKEPWRRSLVQHYAWKVPVADSVIAENSISAMDMQAIGFKRVVGPFEDKWVREVVPCQ